MLRSRGVSGFRERGLATLEACLIIGLLTVGLGLAVPVALSERETMSERQAEHTIQHIGHVLRSEQRAGLIWPCTVCLVVHYGFPDVYGEPADHGRAYVFDAYEEDRFAIFDQHQYKAAYLRQLRRCPESPAGDVTFIVYESDIGLCGAPTLGEPALTQGIPMF